MLAHSLMAILLTLPDAPVARPADIPADLTNWVIALCAVIGLLAPLTVFLGIKLYNKGKRDKASEDESVSVAKLETSLTEWSKDLSDLKTRIEAVKVTDLRKDLDSLTEWSKDLSDLKTRIEAVKVTDLRKDLEDVSRRLALLEADPPASGASCLGVHRDIDHVHASFDKRISGAEKDSGVLTLALEHLRETMEHRFDGITQDIKQLNSNVQLLARDIAERQQTGKQG